MISLKGENIMKKTPHIKRKMNTKRQTQKNSQKAKSITTKQQSIIRKWTKARGGHKEPKVRAPAPNIVKSESFKSASLGNSLQERIDKLKAASQKPFIPIRENLNLPSITNAKQVFTNAQKRLAAQGESAFETMIQGRKWTRPPASVGATPGGKTEQKKFRSIVQKVLDSRHLRKSSEQRGQSVAVKDPAAANFLAELAGSSATQLRTLSPPTSLSMEQNTGSQFERTHKGILPDPQMMGKLAETVREAEVTVPSVENLLLTQSQAALAKKGVGPSAVTEEAPAVQAGPVPVPSVANPHKGRVPIYDLASPVPSNFTLNVSQTPQENPAALPPRPPLSQELPLPPPPLPPPPPPPPPLPPRPSSRSAFFYEKNLQDSANLLAVVGPNPKSNTGSIKNPVTSHYDLMSSFMVNTQPHPQPQPQPQPQPKLELNQVIKNIERAFININNPNKAKQINKIIKHLKEKNFNALSRNVQDSIIKNATYQKYLNNIRNVSRRSSNYSTFARATGPPVVGVPPDSYPSPPVRGSPPSKSTTSSTTGIHHQPQIIETSNYLNSTRQKPTSLMSILSSLFRKGRPHKSSKAFLKAQQNAVSSRRADRNILSNLARRGGLVGIGPTGFNLAKPGSNSLALTGQFKLGQITANQPNLILERSAAERAAAFKAAEKAYSTLQLRDTKPTTKATPANAALEGVYGEAESLQHPLLVSPASQATKPENLYNILQPRTQTLTTETNPPENNPKTKQEQYNKAIRILNQLYPLEPGKTNKTVKRAHKDPRELFTTFLKEPNTNVSYLIGILEANLAANLAAIKKKTEE